MFTLGISPRDVELRRTIGGLAAVARRAAEDGCGKEHDLELGAIPSEVLNHFKHRPVKRLLFALAGVQIRWDARTTRLLPGPAPEMDEEDARRELARRFLRSHGPTRPEQFAEWAAVSVDDARTTFDAIDGDLVSVRWPDGTGFMLASHVEGLQTGEPISGVRLLPFGGDPLLQPGTEVFRVSPAPLRSSLPPRASTVVVLSEGEAVASWGRSQGRVTICPFEELSGARREAIEHEAGSMPVPGPGAPVA